MFYFPIFCCICNTIPFGKDPFPKTENCPPAISRGAAWVMGDYLFRARNRKVTA